MPGDPEGSRVLASRCAEFAATATTPQLKAWFSDLSIQWEKLVHRFRDSNHNHAALSSL
jgi:hypothetical protein